MNLNKYTTYIFDVDGTLYYKRPLQLEMAFRLMLYYATHFYKIKELFLKYGLQVDFNCEVINKEEVLAIKEEQQALEEAEMFKQIEEHKENAKREQKLEEIQKRPRRYAKSTDEVCEPIANIPATQSGIDECINTTGSSTFTIEGENENKLILTSK